MTTSEFRIFWWHIEKCSQVFISEEFFPKGELVFDREKAGVGIFSAAVWDVKLNLPKATIRTCPHLKVVTNI